MDLGHLESSKLYIQSLAKNIWNSILACLEYNVTKMGVPTINIFASTQISEDKIPNISSIKRILSQVVKEVQLSAGSSGASSLVSSTQFINTAKFGNLKNVTSELMTNDITQYKLANGISLNIKKIDKPNGKMSIKIKSLGGKGSILKNADLMGACDLLNNQINPSSYCIYYSGKSCVDQSNNANSSTVDRYPYSFVKSVYKVPSILCASEYLYLSSTFHPACPNYPEASSCTASFNYKGAVEALRLAISPLFDSENIKSTAETIKHNRHSSIYTQDIQTVLSDTVIPLLYSASFNEESQQYFYSYPSYQNLSTVDPIKLNKWIEDHFLFNPERIEINMVGNFLAPTTETLVVGLFNTYFGSLGSKSNTTTYGDTVSNDPYNPQQSDSFDIKVPSHNHFLDCRLKSSVTNRSYVSYTGPLADYKFLHSNLLSSKLLRRSMRYQLFQLIREKYGFSYFASVNTYNSILLSGFGYFNIFWNCGSTFPLNNSFSDDPNNIKNSISKVIETMGKNFISTQNFDLAKSNLMKSFSSDQQTISFWLDQMDLMSLKTPYSWYNGTTSHLIHDVPNNFENFYNMIQYSTISNFLDNSMPSGNNSTVLIAAITTISSDPTGSFFCSDDGLLCCDHHHSI